MMLAKKGIKREAPPAYAVTDHCSRTGAEGGVNRGSPGFPPRRSCSQLPTGNDPDLKFRVEGFQIRIEQCRRSQKLFLPARGQYCALYFELLTGL